MPRVRRKPAKLPEYVQEEIPARGVQVVQILNPVWLHTHKAKRGEVVTVDVELASRLIKQGAAERYVR